jgi:transposase-like protein
MSIVVLKLPNVKATAEGRPTCCPVCKGETHQRWGGQVRTVKDPHLQQVVVFRYRCCTCRHTFRHYPEGVNQAQQTQRLRTLAAFGWVLGLSYRGIAALFQAFRVEVSRMSAWRDTQERSEQFRKQRKWKPVRVLGLDGAWVRGWGEQRGVVVAVDLGEGQPVAVGYVDEKNPQALRKWLEPLVKQLGVSVIVTDDLVSYRKVAEKLDLEHQVCQFHVRRWVGKSLHNLRETVPKEWLWVLDEVKQLLADLPLEGNKRLLELYMQIPERYSSEEKSWSALALLRQLVLRLSEHWISYRVFAWQKDVPWTNNGTEQVIGRMKMRSRTVREYKSEQTMLNGLLVAGSGVA